MRRSLLIAFVALLCAAPAALAAFSGHSASGRYQGATNQDLGAGGGRPTVSFRLGSLTMTGIRVRYRLTCRSRRTLGAATARLADFYVGLHSRTRKYPEASQPFTLPRGTPGGTHGTARFGYSFKARYAGGTRMVGWYAAHLRIFDARGRLFDVCGMPRSGWAATRRGR